jgi:hypothetical protein
MSRSQQHNIYQEQTDTFPQSFTLILDNVGRNKQITMPQEIDVFQGSLVLKSYFVHMHANNTTIDSVQVNIHSLTHQQSIQNSTQFLSLPVSKNGVKSTLAYTDLVMNVSGNRLKTNIRYDLLNDDLTDFDTDNGNYPTKVYLNFSYRSSQV